MEITEDLSEKMRENDEIIKEIRRIEEKLLSSDVPEGKKEKLRYRHEILKKKLREEQRSLY